MFHLRFRLRSLIILVIPAVGIGPDRIRYGFAYRPNPEGTPFGRARYGLSNMVGDWYCFSASNDGWQRIVRGEFDR